MSIAPALSLWILAPLTFAVIGFTVWRSFADRPHRNAWWRRGGAVLLLALIALRPGVPDPDARSVNANLDVFFVVDTTASIAAEDFNGDAPRLEGVEADINAIADAMPGARFSLISFDQRGRVDLPLTEDTTSLRTAADVLRPEIAWYSAGSSPLVAVATMQERLAAAAEAEPDRQRIVFFFSDGETTTDSPPDASFASLAELVDDGAVLGYGTPEGGPMLENLGYDLNAEPSYIRGEGGNAISHADMPAMEAIAGDLGVPFVHRTAPGGVTAIVDGIDPGEFTASEDELAGRADLGWFLAAPLLALLVLELRGLLRELARVTPNRQADAPTQRHAPPPGGRPTQRTHFTTARGNQ